MSEFIQKILAGSKELDRRREDTTQMLRILFGLLRISDEYYERFSTDDYRFKFMNGDHVYSWEIRRRLRDARLLQTTGDGSKTTALFTTDQRWIGEYEFSENVTVAWDTLPKLVEELLEDFPKLEELAAPLLKAAE